MRKIKKGDTVKIVTGRDKGRQGTVLSVNERRLLVEGINLIKKHTKPNPDKQIEGGIIQKESPIDVSNVALLNTATGKADRVGFKVLEDGRKVRVYKSTGEMVDHA